MIADKEVAEFYRYVAARMARELLDYLALVNPERGQPEKQAIDLVQQALGCLSENKGQQQTSPDVAA